MVIYFFIAAPLDNFGCMYYNLQIEKIIEIKVRAPGAQGKAWTL